MGRGTCMCGSEKGCVSDHGCVTSIHKTGRKKIKTNRPAEDHQDMKPAPMQCTMTQKESKIENVNKMKRR